MQKRYQVFVSSTFEDLKPERQAAVEAILKAGHIPAGMELFTAGDQSQMDVIRHWIDQSDIFMLILGARYGSLEPSTALSYTELEFNYAREKGKPFFAVVLSDAGRDQKVKEHGLSAIEQRNEEACRRFRQVVTSQLCAFCDDPKGVKLAVFETLPQLSNERNLTGWVSAADLPASLDVAGEIARLSAENQSLRAERDRLAAQASAVWGELGSFEQIRRATEAIKLTVPVSVYSKGPYETSLYRLTVMYAHDLARGVANNVSASETESFLFFNVASRLATFGLTAHVRVPASVHWQRLGLSRLGIKFVAAAQVATAAESAVRDAAAKGQAPAEPQEEQESDATNVESRPSLNDLRQKASEKKKRTAPRKKR